MPEKVVIGSAELWHGNCLEVLPLLPQFDLALTDPPYGTGGWRRDASGAGSNPAAKLVREQWDDGALEWLRLCRGVPVLTFWPAAHMPELMGAAVACGYDKVRMLYMRKLDPKPQVGGRVSWAVEPIVALGNEGFQLYGGTDWCEASTPRITRDGFAFLCMGFTGAKAAQWKERYIATFNRMAERLAAKAARPHHVAQPRNMAPALPGPDALRAHMAAGLSPAQPLPPAVAALVDRRAWDLCAEAFPLLRDHIARQVAFRTIPADRAEPTPALHAVLAQTTLTTALAGPIRAAEQRAMTFIEIAARCTQQALQEARAARAGDAP